MSIVIRHMYNVRAFRTLFQKAVSCRFFSLFTYSAVAMSLIFGCVPVYSASIGDPARFVSYDKPGIPIHRVMRGLGGPDRIERHNDGTSIFWYRWMIEQQDGHISARGMAAFSFAKDEKLNGFEILTMDEKGDYVDSTLDSVLNLTKR